MRASFAIALAVICTVLPFAGQFAGDRSGGWLMIDFRAYYCASLAQRLGRDPYFTASVHECESKTPAPYYRAPKNVTVPAPYPPYALAFFAPLTFLPFPVAAILWWIALALSILLAAYALARIARQPMLVAWGALVLSLGLSSFWSGNVMPVAFAALIVAALAVQRGRLAIAVPAVALAMVEPQIALPAAIGLFVACSRVRVALILAATLLGIISVASSGVAQTLSYLTAVAPAHALSEVSRDNQYSLSTVLAALGVPDVSAALEGSISYVVVSAVGVLVALRLARRFDDPSLTVLVPAAFSVLGGTFVHTGEIAVAIPACLVLFTQARAVRRWLFIALILLVVPWMLAASAVMFLAPAFPVAYIAYTLSRGDRAVALGAAVASFAFIAGLFALYSIHYVPMAFHPHLYPPIDPRLAESSWRQFVLPNVTNRPVMWLLRFPTWVGLIILATCAALLAERRGARALVAERMAHGR
ncbi:MAG: glycosyltransferase 87 family protein [Candidatus Cybelea sp.]